MKERCIWRERISKGEGYKERERGSEEKGIGRERISEGEGGRERERVSEGEMYREREN